MNETVTLFNNGNFDRSNYQNNKTCPVQKFYRDDEAKTQHEHFQTKYDGGEGKTMIERAIQAPKV